MSFYNNNCVAQFKKSADKMEHSDIDESEKIEEYGELIRRNIRPYGNNFMIVEDNNDDIVETVEDQRYYCRQC